MNSLIFSLIDISGRDIAYIEIILAIAAFLSRGVYHDINPVGIV